MSSNGNVSKGASFLKAAGEVLLLVCLCIVYAGGAPPSANEAHYLAKARHYWDPSWCGRDLFLESADAHAIFFLTFGWLTNHCSLAVTAVIGRLIGWLMLAIGWRALSQAIVPGRLVPLLTGAWFLMLLHYGHMSGEWIVGGIEAKVPAYAFAFLGLAALVSNNWRTVWLWFGLAGLFHVLVGGWCILAAMLAWLMRRSDRLPLRDMWPWWIGGVLLAIPSVVIGLRLQLEGVDAATANIADRILVYRRLGHHLAFHQIEHALIARFGVLVVAAHWLARPLMRLEIRHARLSRFVLGSLAIAGCGVLIDQLLLNHLKVAAPLLKYYWFRLADVTIPMSVAFSMALWRDRGRNDGAGRGGWLLVALILVPTLVLGHLAWRGALDSRPEADRLFDRTVPTRVLAERKFANWLRVCRWIRRETDRDAIFLTPRDQQTFKWYAERAEVVTWKDVPQDAAHILEWRRRWRAIYSWPASRDGVTAWSIGELAAKMRSYDAEFVVVERPKMLHALSSPFERVYPNPREENADFDVYRLGPSIR